MSISTLVKFFIPIDWLFKLKYLKKFGEQSNLEFVSGKKIYYLDAPDYGNLGDQAIAYAIRMFAQKYYPDYQFVEVLQKDLASYSNYLKQNITANDVIFLTGGGNCGNLYRIYEATRRYVVYSFPNSRIIVFPQSLAYTNNLFGKISYIKAKTIYDKPNVIMCAREKLSYCNMKKLNTNCLLVPDIVLSLNIREKLDNIERNGAGFCLRNDIERLLSFSDYKMIENTLRENFAVTFPLSTTPTNVVIEQIDQTNREQILLEKLNEFKRCKVVVTDRLHAMIFCILTDTPCVAFDNNNHKISQTAEWFHTYQKVKVIDSVSDLLPSIKSVIAAVDSLNMESKYNSLIKCFK